jgi:O-antigen/teichoic acid export membrane protein
MARRVDDAPAATRLIYRRLAKNSTYLAVGTAASALFTMLAAILNARALSAREFGLLVLFQSTTMMIASLMSFATQQPVIKLGSTALVEGDLARLGRIIGLGLFIDGVGAILAALLAFGFLAFAGDWLQIDHNDLSIAIVFAASLLFTGYLTANGVFRLLDRFGLLSLIQTVCAAGILLATIVLYVRGAPFQSFCWAWAIFYAANGLLPLLVALHLVRKQGIPIAFSFERVEGGEVRTFLAYCWTTWGMATADTFRSNGDSLLVGAAVSVEAAGIYNVAKQLAGVLRKLNTVYASAAFPEISTLSSRGEADNAQRVRKRILLVSGVVGAIAVVAAALLGRFVLVHLFGSQFEPAYIPLVILTAAAAAQLISHTLSIYVQVYVGPEKLFRIYCLAILVFLLAVYPLTAAFSIGGTAATQVLFTLALIWFCSRALRATDAA